MAKFPSFEEIQDLKEKHRKSPERRKRIMAMIEEILDYNGDEIRKAAESGLTDFDLDRFPIEMRPTLRELQISEPDLYRMLEIELRRRGYHTLLSIFNEDTGEMFCDLLIGW